MRNGEDLKWTGTLLSVLRPALLLPLLSVLCISHAVPPPTLIPSRAKEAPWKNIVPASLNNAFQTVSSAARPVPRMLVNHLLAAPASACKRHFGRLHSASVGSHLCKMADGPRYSDD